MDFEKVKVAYTLNTLYTYAYTLNACDFVRSNSFIPDRLILYNASSSPLLLRGAPDCSIATVSELTCRSALYRQLRVKNMPN